jgi:hypothetical protein
METPQPDARPEIETMKQLASLRQIGAAIQHFHKQEFECVITLAAAAEGLLPPTNDPHLFRDLKEHVTPEEYKELNFNLVINWLKHYNPEDPEPVKIPEFEVVIMLTRAITKSIALFHKLSRRMEGFLTWARSHNYLVPGGSTSS